MGNASPHTAGAPAELSVRSIHWTGVAWQISPPTDRGASLRSKTGRAESLIFGDENSLNWWRNGLAARSGARSARLIRQTRPSSIFLRTIIITLGGEWI